MGKIKVISAVSAALISIMFLPSTVGAEEGIGAGDWRSATSNQPREAAKKKPSDIIPNVPDPGVILQGGDDISSATPITTLPFYDSGTTTGYTDDYDESCYWTSDSPDVVYSFYAAADMIVCVDLCDGSEYDTKLFVYENEYTPGEPYACNDDACPNYESRLDNLFLAAGNTYYIVVDGYGGAHGNYILEVYETLDCVICPYGSTPEGEPDCYDGYEDHFNGGCGSDPTVFGSISCGETVCGRSGVFLYEGMPTRDTDWYDFHLAVGGLVTITAKAEYFMQVLIIQPGPDVPCEGMQVLYSESVPMCEEYSFEADLATGDYWIWVAPEDYDAPLCGSEYYLRVACEDQTQIPTLSEWGMILLGLLLVGTATVAVVRRRLAEAR